MMIVDSARFIRNVFDKYYQRDHQQFILLIQGIFEPPIFEIKADSDQSMRVNKFISLAIEMNEIRNQMLSAQNRKSLDTNELIRLYDTHSKLRKYIIDQNI